jgi:hypothetical protein
MLINHGINISYNSLIFNGFVGKCDIKNIKILLFYFKNFVILGVQLLRSAEIIDFFFFIL